MGMFDRIWVPCPDCGENVEFQSKSGECILASYDLDNAPRQTLIGIERDQGYCHSCKKSFEVDIEPYMIKDIKPLKVILCPHCSKMISL